MGSGEQQVAELAETIRRADCDAVLIATPVDLRRLFEMRQPTARLTYRFEVRGTPTLDDLLRSFLQQALAAAAQRRGEYQKP
jgi:predicted GTPase